MNASKNTLKSNFALFFCWVKELSVFLFMAEGWYQLHYQQRISPNLTDQQKEDVAKKISELTLRSPIWEDKKVDYSEQFPELKPYINTKLTGLYLCGILKGIVNDLQNKK